MAARDVKKFTDEQVECSKKKWDETKAEYANKSRNFVVRPSCGKN